MSTEESIKYSAREEVDAGATAKAVVRQNDQDYWNAFIDRIRIKESSTFLARKLFIKEDTVWECLNEPLSKMFTKEKHILIKGTYTVPEFAAKAKTYIIEAQAPFKQALALENLMKAVVLRLAEEACLHW